MANWKAAPGWDRVQWFQMKNFEGLHFMIASHFREPMENKSIPEWMTSGVTYLLLIDIDKV